MATAIMTEVKVYGAEEDEKAWEYEETISAAGNSYDVFIPNGVNVCTVTAESTATGVTVYHTTSTVAAVTAGTARWKAWALGSITTINSDKTSPVTAIRAIQVGAGASIFSIRAQ